MKTSSLFICLALNLSDLRLIDGSTSLRANNHDHQDEPNPRRRRMRLFDKTKGLLEDRICRGKLRTCQDSHEAPPFEKWEALLDAMALDGNSFIIQVRDLVVKAKSVDTQRIIEDFASRNEMVVSETEAAIESQKRKALSTEFAALQERYQEFSTVRSDSKSMTMHNATELFDTAENVVGPALKDMSDDLIRLESSVHDVFGEGSGADDLYQVMRGMADLALTFKADYTPSTSIILSILGILAFVALGVVVVTVYLYVLMVLVILELIVLFILSPFVILGGRARCQTELMQCEYEKAIHKPLEGLVQASHLVYTTTMPEPIWKSALAEMAIP